MKYSISILTLLILSLNFSFADEAKIKTRGINNNEQLKMRKFHTKYIPINYLKYCVQ